MLQALQSSMEGKEEARYQLELWQKERVPGFLQVLVDLVARREDVSVELRMYAAIIAKNKIGAQWTRSETTSFGGSFAEKKGWALISDGEKENLKSRLLQLLFSEPEESTYKDVTVQQQKGKKRKRKEKKSTIQGSCLPTRIHACVSFSVFDVRDKVFVTNSVLLCV